VTLGFNVPQTGAYADEGADELRAYELAVEHINGEGDGGMLNTFSSKELKGDGVNGKKVEFVTGDTQTKSDAARASAKRMIEKDGAVMITGGSSSGVAIAVQGLCQEAGVIFMAGLTHSTLARTSAPTVSDISSIPKCLVQPSVQCWRRHSALIGRPTT